MADDFDPAEFAAAKPAAGEFNPAEFAKAAPDKKSPVKGQITIPTPIGSFTPSVIDVAKSVYEAGKSAITAPGDAIGGSFAPPLQTPGVLTEEDVFRQDMARTKEAERAGDIAALTPAISPSARVGVGWMGAHKTPAAPPPRPTPGPFGVTLSEGQATRDLPAIQREQAALRNQSGAPAQRRAQEFRDQQDAQLAAARDDLARGLDPYGQVIAETPQAAGDIVSQGVRGEAAQRKAGVTQAYDAAKGYPGEIHASAFEGIAPKIKYELSNRAEPIVIDDKLTPFASRAIQDIEDRVAKLTIQNRADPFGVPNPENIVGVNLNGVDQMRKRLSAFRRDAYASGNAADGRAAKGVLDAFDAQVDRAVNGGLFNGDPRAVQAWNAARAAHADYRSTFSAGKNDPVGRVVEKIIGKNNNVPAIPNDVADFFMGATGTNASSLNVGVAKRIKGILGEQSPEWIGAKQGLLSRLIEPPAGIADWGPKKVADGLNKFLNGGGKELSQVVYSAQERQLLQSYAKLMRQLEVPQAGANWSGTGAALAPLLQKIGGRIGTLVSAFIGGLLSHATGFGFLGEVAGAGIAQTSKVIGDANAARALAKQMPIVAEQIKQWQRAVAAANKSNSPPSQSALALATGNLTRSLNGMGINLPALQGPGIGRAAEDQQNDIPRPPREQKNGGAVGNNKGFAHGGKVPPVHRRKEGGTYHTPKGPAIWRGKGWEARNKAVSR